MSARLCAACVCALKTHMCTKVIFEIIFYPWCTRCALISARLIAACVCG